MGDHASPLKPPALLGTVGQEDRVKGVLPPPCPRCTWDWRRFRCAPTTLPPHPSPSPSGTPLTPSFVTLWCPSGRGDLVALQDPLSVPFPRWHLCHHHLPNYHHPPKWGVAHILQERGGDNIFGVTSIHFHLPAFPRGCCVILHPPCTASPEGTLGTLPVSPSPAPHSTSAAACAQPQFLLQLPTVNRQEFRSYPHLFLLLPQVGCLHGQRLSRAESS